MTWYARLVATKQRGRQRAGKLDFQTTLFNDQGLLFGLDGPIVSVDGRPVKYHPRRVYSCARCGARRCGKRGEVCGVCVQMETKEAV
jgi:hypothetical protein